MKKIKSIVPDCLTWLRICLTIEILMIELDIVYLDLLQKSVFCIVLTIVVYITDLLDGKLARRWKVCSQFGEKLDVIADLFYIISQSMFSCWNGKMPIIIIFCIIGEFFVFLYTSFYLKDSSSKKAFFFETVGKLMAGYYYILPMIYLVSTKEIGLLAEIICIIGTVAVIFYRILLVLQAGKIRKQRICLKKLIP